MSCWTHDPRVAREILSDPARVIIEVPMGEPIEGPDENVYQQTLTISLPSSPVVE